MTLICKEVRPHECLHRENFCSALCAATVVAPRKILGANWLLCSLSQVPACYQKYSELKALKSCDACFRSINTLLTAGEITTPPGGMERAPSQNTL